MSQALEIRPAEIADLPAAAGLLSTLNPDTPHPVIVARLAEIRASHPHYHLVCALAGETLVGVAAAWIATKIWCGKYLEIDNLVVAESHRSAGVGTHLINHLEALGRQHACNLLVLDSYTSNHPSHRLYHRLGFEIWGFHFIKPVGDWKGTSAPSGSAPA